MLYVCEVSPAHCVAVPVIVPGVAGVGGLIVAVTAVLVDVQPVATIESIA